MRVLLVLVRLWLFKKNKDLCRLAPGWPPVSLTAEMIFNASSDKALITLLGDELLRVIPMEVANGNYDNLAQYLKTLPVGLRSMAAVHRLDISLSLDSLVEHFENFPGQAYAEETILGLLELGLPKIAEQFENAIIAVKPFINHYRAQSLSQETKSQLTAITEIIWSELEHSGISSLLDSWPNYARKHPEKVVINPTNV